MHRGEKPHKANSRKDIDIETLTHPSCRPAQVLPETMLYAVRDNRVCHTATNKIYQSTPKTTN